MSTIDTISRAEDSAVHWGCAPPTTTTSAEKPRVLGTCLRSWQRTLIYVVLVTLIVLVLANIALTLWLIAALRLTSTGIGPIRIVRGGLQLDGQALVMDKLVASTLTSRPGQPITLHSYRNFSILVSDTERDDESKFIIKRDSVEFGGRMFSVSDSQGKQVFSASREAVVMAAESLVVDGVGGVNVRGAVQTASVRAPPGSDLRLESQTRRLEFRAPQEINLESRAGNIDISSHTDIKLVSVVGALKIDAQNIYMGKLPEAKPYYGGGVVPRGGQQRPIKTYQLCACADGKLFLATAEGACASRPDDHLCR